MQIYRLSPENEFISLDNDKQPSMEFRYDTKSRALLTVKQGKFKVEFSEAEYTRMQNYFRAMSTFEKRPPITA